MSYELQEKDGLWWIACTCEFCRQPISFPLEKAGQECPCPACAKPRLVPDPEATPDASKGAVIDANRTVLKEAAARAQQRKNEAEAWAAKLNLERKRHNRPETPSPMPGGVLLAFGAGLLFLSWIIGNAAPDVHDEGFSRAKMYVYLIVASAITLTALAVAMAGIVRIATNPWFRHLDGQNNALLDRCDLLLSMNENHAKTANEPHTND